MNSPYQGRFKITQTFKGASHDGLDLVGIDSKEIHATISGVVQYAGWENAANHSQGFGQYVCIKGTDGRFYYYGHLSELKVKTGQAVKITDVVGIEGYTGYTIPSGPNGQHCHYCIRPRYTAGCYLDVTAISGIPNVLGGVYDDGYRPGQKPAEKKTVKVTLEYDDHKYSGLLEEL